MSRARSMVTRYAMVPELGHLAHEEESGGAFLGPSGAIGFSRRQNSDETNREIDHAVRALVNTAFERALNILQTHRSLLEEGAKKLLAEETLDDTQLAPLFSRIARATWLSAAQ